MLCASFVVQSSTGKCFVQALWYKVVLGSALCKLCSTKYWPLHTPHSTLSTPHCRLVTGEICTVFKQCFPCVSLCVSCLLWTVDQVPLLRRYARTMHKKIRFPVAEIFARSPRTCIHSGSWLPSCFLSYESVKSLVEATVVLSGFFWKSSWRSRQCAACGDSWQPGNCALRQPYSDGWMMDANSIVANN